MFRLINWGRASTTANEPLTALQSGVIQGCFNTFVYYAQDNNGGDGDTQATIAGAGYFNQVNYELKTGDVIYAESAQESSVVSYRVINTDGVITVAAFNFGAGAIGTPNILNGAVTYAKIQDVAANSLIGNPTGAPDTATDVGLGNGLTLAGGNLSVLNTYMVTGTGNITAAQWNAMYGAPIQLVPAPGANLMVVVDSFILNMDFLTTQYAAGGDVQIQYANTVHAGGVNAGSGIISAATINGLAANEALPLGGFIAPILTATAINAGVYLTNATQLFTTGDSTWTWKIKYRVITAL